MTIVNNAVKKLRKKYNVTHIDYAIVLGSGLKNCAPKLDNQIVVTYKDLNLPESKVKGHGGCLVMGTYNEKIVALVSRMHYYESGDITKVRIPLEIMASLGAKTAILLTSCGGLNTTFKVGDIMLIDDHINLSGTNPIIATEQIKFVNMADCYSSNLRKKAKAIAKKHKIDLKSGIHVQMSGPSYETCAEVEMLRKLGGDSVSMSTVHDTIIAKYLNMEVIGFSVIVNVFNGNEQNLSHQEVLENAERACQNLNKIINNLIG